MFRGHLDYFQKPPLWGRPNTKPGDHGILNAHNYRFILFYHVWGPAIAFGWGPGHVWLHTALEDPWPHYMNWEVCWDGLWTLSFGLSQFHGHGSWLVCEVALKLCDLIVGTSTSAAILATELVTPMIAASQCSSFQNLNKNDKITDVVVR